MAGDLDDDLSIAARGRLRIQRKKSSIGKLLECAARLQKIEKAAC
jgi:hypothetical protein